MNEFNRTLKEKTALYPLKAADCSRFVINLGEMCNLRCAHCYVSSSPEKTKMMSLETVDKILDVLRKNRGVSSIEITGGAPEMSPHFRHLVRSAAEMGKRVTTASNGVIFFEPGMEYIPQFLADNKVKIYMSLPSYNEADVDRQRGRGVYKKIIAALQLLNGLGYGKEGTGLELDLMYNPLKTSLPPDEQTMEKLYREKLMEMHNITFNNLLFLNNMPIGRMRDNISDDELEQYMMKMESRFSPENVETMMCRHLVSIGYDELIYDCGFSRQLQMAPAKLKDPHISSFNFEEVKNREISTNRLCFVCSAGQGCAKSFVERDLIAREF